MTTCSVCGEPNDAGQAACSACGTVLRAGDGRASSAGAGMSVVPNAPIAEPTAPVPSGMSASAGEMIAGRYELIEILGRGGVGVVYRARDRELNEMLAIKLLAGPSSSDPQEVERFKREIITARRITHNNVIRIHDFGMSGAEAFISMELLPGGTLADVIEKESPVPISRAVEIAIGVCEGLEAAHAQGIVHRDLKPDNVLFDANGAPKLVDFGLARLATSTTKTVGFSGTPFYMSPEQADGSEVTSRSDLYSLGVLLYELFTGKLPFVADSLVRIAMLHAHEPPPAPRSVRADLPVEIEALLLRSLQKDPVARYARAADIAEDLRLFISGRPMKHTAVTELPRSPSRDTAAVRPTRQPTLTNSKVGGVRISEAVPRADAARNESTLIMNSRLNAIPVADAKSNPSQRGQQAPLPRRPSISRPNAPLQRQAPSDAQTEAGRRSYDGESSASRRAAATEPDVADPFAERPASGSSRAKLLVLFPIFAVLTAFVGYGAVRILGAATPTPAPTKVAVMVTATPELPVATPTVVRTAVVVATPVANPTSTPRPTARPRATATRVVVAPTPVVPAARGTLVVRSPGGYAKFQIDGVGRMLDTPLPATTLDAGSHVLQILAGSQQLERTVVITANRTTTLTLNMSNNRVTSVTIE